MSAERPADCCETVDDAGTFCPLSGHAGLVVGALPVRAHRPTAVAGRWRYCPNRACEIVFFLDDDIGGDIVDDQEVICQVGAKALTKPTPVCFCFAHTVEDIRIDVATHDGSSTIMAKVKAAVADVRCACEHLNPSGVCCLPAVHRAVTMVRQQISGGVAGG